MVYVVFILHLKTFSNQQRIFTRYNDKNISLKTQKNRHRLSNDRRNDKNIKIDPVYLSLSNTRVFVMECEIVSSDKLINAAYHSRINPGLQHYRNVVITQTGSWGLFRQCSCNDNSNIKMYICLIFIHIHFYTL